MSSVPFELRPGVTNRNLWEPERPPQAEWNRIRKVVLERDNYTCTSCSHHSLKFMHVHHLSDSENNAPENLSSLCVACHAILHMGRNLSLGTIEIWKSSLSQVEIVRATREGVRAGKNLGEINASFGLKKGRYAPGSMLWANSLLDSMGPEPRASLQAPLCAVFIEFKQWQL